MIDDNNRWNLGWSSCGCNKHMLSGVTPGGAKYTVSTIVLADRLPGRQPLVPHPSMNGGQN